MNSSCMNKPQEVLMAKKMVSVLVLAAVVTAGVFAQSKGKSAVSIDIVPLVRSGLVVEDTAGFGLGLTYERLFTGSLSIGARLEFVSADKTTYFGLDAHGRWYPLGASLEKLFLDAGLGYGGLSYDGTTTTDGLTFGLKAGWKLPATPKVFLEPTIGYTLAKNTQGFGPGGLGIGFSIGTIF
jgi:hypothetical protein